MKHLTQWDITLMFLIASVVINVIAVKVMP